jgi:hypothetical protein
MNNRVSAFSYAGCMPSRGCFGTGLQNEIHPVCDLRATAAAADNRYSATR